MGRKLVQVNIDLLAAWLTQGNIIGDVAIVHVTAGIPVNAQFIRGWYAGDGSKKLSVSVCSLTSLLAGHVPGDRV